jgi:hypothetical protein
LERSQATFETRPKRRENHYRDNLQIEPALPIARWKTAGAEVHRLIDQSIVLHFG